MEDTLPKPYRETRLRKSFFQLASNRESTLQLYDHLPFQIAVVSNLLQLNRDSSIRSIINLEPRELRVILNIGSYSPITAAEIAYQSRLDSYTVTRAVKTLKKRGLVDSKMKKGNRKAKYLSLTDEGAQVYDQLCEVIEERTQLLESVLSDGERDTLMNALSKLEDRAEQLLAEHALSRSDKGETIQADQRELIRWRKRSIGESQ